VLTACQWRISYFCAIFSVEQREMWEFKKSQFQSKYWNFETLKYLPTKMFGCFWHQTFSLSVVMIYSAMVWLWLMTYCPSELNITPSISPPYSPQFTVAPNSNMVHVLPLKFRKIFLSDLNSNFHLVSGVW
jgi:hypothetical protein